MMKTAIILHGTLGSPEGNWFQWLKDQLEAKGLQVWLPQLPHAEQPSLKEWAEFVHANCPFEIDGETLIVGHSSGAILAIILAQQNPEPIGQIVCVSVFHDNSLQWKPNNKLFDVAFDWPAVRTNAKKLLFIHSDNDPYVPLGQAQFVADNCQVDLITIPGQGHFNLEQSEEYRQFPKLLEILGLSKKMLVFISGSINSGKTTTSKLLADKLGAKFINVDDLNDRIPDFNLATDLDKSMDLAIAEINKYLADGHDVVANYVVREEDWQRLQKEVHTPNVLVITLAPRIEVAQGKRGDRTLTEWEVARVKHHYDTGIASPKFGNIIDNSDISPEETVSEILRIIER